MVMSKREHGDFEGFDGRVDLEAFDRLLACALIRQASDLTLTPGACVVARISGEGRLVTAEAVSQANLAYLVRETYGENGLSCCSGGDFLDYAYDTLVPDDYRSAVGTERMRFRVNATPRRTAGGIGLQLSLKPLAAREAAD